MTIPLLRQAVVGYYDASLTDSSLVARRGTAFALTVYVPSQTETAPAAVACRIEATVEPEGSGATTVEAFPADAVAVSLQRSGSSTTVTLALAAGAPVGRATVVCDVTPPAGGGARFEARKEVIVLFNPYSASDGTYLEGEAARSEYLTATKGVIFQGLSDNWEGHVWAFDQFTTPNLAIALRSLRRLPVADRASLPLVTRHLSYAVGADVCYGKWGEG
eukprot:2845939-Prymnesium_polylepis.1